MTFKMTTLALALSLAVCAMPAQAADESIKYDYGIINMNRVMKETNAAKGIFSELEGKRNEYQKQVEQEEKTLRAAQDEIIKQSSKMSKEEFGKKRDEFDKKLMEAQKKVQDRKQQLDEAFTVSMSKLRDEAAKIVASIAKKRGYNTVFTQDAVLLAEPGLDMTEDVIAQLNKELKKIPIEWNAKKK